MYFISIKPSYWLISLYGLGINLESRINKEKTAIQMTEKSSDSHYRMLSFIPIIFIPE